MGCTSSRLQQDFDEASSYTKLPIMAHPGTGAKIPFAKVKSIGSPKPTLSSTSSWTSTSTTSATPSSAAPQHPAFTYERPRPHPLLRKTSSRLRVVLDNDDVDATSPIVTQARMPFTPDDIREKPIRRFDSLARRETPPPPPPVSMQENDLQRVISLGQMYMQMDRGSRDRALSDVEVEAMVAASEYVNGRNGGYGSQVWGLGRRKSDFRRIVQEVLED